MGKGDDGQGPDSRARKTPFIHKMEKSTRNRVSLNSVVCPSYYVLSHANGCPYRCDYCCLQLPLKNVRTPIVFANQEKLIEEVKAFLRRNEPQVLSAGESSDSLALKAHARLFCRLIPLFARQDEDRLFPKERPHKLLLVTKSTNVEPLLAIEEKRHTVISFSLNAPEVAAQYEHGAPHPFERLKAAVACKQAGYEVRLRIDPILPVDQWQQQYLPLIQLLRRELASSKDLGQTRITLGTIRHNPGLRDCAVRRGRKGSVFDAAVSQDGADGRFRLPVEQRSQIYGWFTQELESNASIALCKETNEVWQTVTGSPGSPGKPWTITSMTTPCNCAL